MRALTGKDHQRDGGQDVEHGHHHGHHDDRDGGIRIGIHHGHQRDAEDGVVAARDALNEHAAGGAVMAQARRDKKQHAKTAQRGYKRIQQGVAVKGRAQLRVDDVEAQ